MHFRSLILGLGVNLEEKNYSLGIDAQKSAIKLAMAAWYSGMMALISSIVDSI